jgi:hypothetical protein
MDKEFDYDVFVNTVEMYQAAAPHAWVVARSLDEAKAFAAWCVENGIEEPEIIIRG